MIYLVHILHTPTCLTSSFPRLLDSSNFLLLSPLPPAPALALAAVDAGPVSVDAALVSVDAGPVSVDAVDVLTLGGRDCGKDESPPNPPFSGFRASGGVVTRGMGGASSAAATSPALTLSMSVLAGRKSLQLLPCASRSISDILIEIEIIILFYCTYMYMHSMHKIKNL